MREGTTSAGGGGRGTETRRPITRRRALGVIGAGALGATTAVVGSAQSGAAATVEEGGGGYRATVGGSTVYDGGDLAAAIQSAVDGLSDGRSSKERVLVTASGRIGESVHLPSYTTLDLQGTLTAADGVIPIYADRVESIEVANYDLRGSPGMGMRIRRADDVVLGTITMDVDSGIGIRIDDAHNDGTPETTTNVRIDSVEITGTGSHGVETYGVDGFELNEAVTADTGGCGVLLNTTANATVGRVDATRADEGGGYAGFRCANDAGPNVSVDRVEAVSCGRGIFTVSGSRGITIGEVHLENNGGNLIQDTRDLTIEGGTVVGTGGSGFRVDSRNSGSHPHTRNVTIRNCAIEDNGGWGVRETGPETANNTIEGNAFCNNGSGAVQTFADSTTVTDNTYDCSGTPDGGTCEPTAIDPYLQVDGGEWRNTDAVGVQAGTEIRFGPHPTEGGSWSWSGPGLSATTREVTVAPTETSTYTATHENDCGETSTAEFTVTVDGRSGGPPSVAGATPTDPDGDGLYEDLSGNGATDPSDVVRLFENLDDPAVADHPEYYDFSGNGGVEVADVVELFGEL